MCRTISKCDRFKLVHIFTITLSFKSNKSKKIYTVYIFKTKNFNGSDEKFINKTKVKNYKSLQVSIKGFLNCFLKEYQSNFFY